jgi:hypothetical protein
MEVLDDKGLLSYRGKRGRSRGKDGYGNAIKNIKTLRIIKQGKPLI